MENSWAKTARKFQSKSARKFPCMTRHVTHEEYLDVTTGLVDGFYGHLRHATELTARLIGATPRTIRNWMDRQCAPSGPQLLNLMIENDAFAEAINRLIQEKRACGEDAGSASSLVGLDLVAHSIYSRTSGSE